MSAFCHVLVEQTCFGFSPSTQRGYDGSHRPSIGVPDGQCWIQENSSMTQCAPLGTWDLSRGLLFMFVQPRTWAFFIECYTRVQWWCRFATFVQNLVEVVNLNLASTSLFRLYHLLDDSSYFYSDHQYASDLLKFDKGYQRTLLVNLARSSKILYLDTGQVFVRRLRYIHPKSFKFSLSASF